MTRWIAPVLALALAATTAAAGPPDTLVLGMQLEPPHLDPTAGAAGAIREVTYANLYEGLTRIDRTGAVKPSLAESWSMSGDGLTVTFKLRAGVAFHDGTPFDSSIVKFTLERALAPDSTNAQKQLFAPIASIAAPDPLTAVVTLKQPTANFVYNMGWGDAVMLAPASVADNKTKPIGTGPFKFERWARGDRIELVKNAAYRDAASIKLSKVTFRFIADPQAGIAALKAGDVDAFANVAAVEALDELQRDAKFKVVVGNTEGETIVAINNAKPALSDLRVRRALAHAIDRKAVIEGAMSGRATPIGSHFSPLHPAYVDLTGRYPYDPALAKKLLAEAGQSNLSLSLHLPPPAYARRSGEIVAAYLGQVGIKVQIVPIEFPQWLDQVFKRKDYDLTIIAHTEPLDIDIYARDDYYFNYRSQPFKDLIATINRTLDVPARQKLYGDAQRMLAEDCVNVFLFQLPKLGVWNAKLDGLWENSPLQANDVTGVSWR
ncbi:MAG: ABC transporter substrate-binding protein [Alphaproteobacteria bacterium]|nr:ABC transporter substrate-binding protein [Alphaproteobacteria bacterium]